MSKSEKLPTLASDIATLDAYAKDRGQAATCGQCKNTPTAFPELITYDAFGNALVNTFMWGLCSDHAHEIPLHKPSPRCCSVFERRKLMQVGAHKERYGHDVTQVEVKMHAFSSPRGAKVLAHIGGMPKPAPEIQLLEVQGYGNIEEFNEECQAYGIDATKRKKLGLLC